MKPVTSSPTVRRRVLASELRNLRRNAGLTHVDVANRLGWQQGKVSKIESAKQGVGIDAVFALAEVCHASPAHRDRLVELAREARAKGWWEAYGDVLPAAQRLYIGMEADADVHSVFAVEGVPELLRAREYAENFLKARGGAAEPGRAVRALEVLLKRQQTVFERPDVSFDVVLSESVLRRIVGGPAVMREQCASLARAAARPNVVLRVLPFSVGALPVECPFSLLEYRRAPHPEVAFVPGRSAFAYHEGEVEVRPYRTAMTELRELAWSPDESVAFMRDAEQQLVAVGSGSG